MIRTYSSEFTKFYVSGIKIVRLGRDGVGNRAHCSEEENGNAGELHGKRLVL